MRNVVTCQGIHMRKINPLAFLIILITISATSYAIPVEDFITESNTWATYLKEIQNLTNQVTIIHNQLTQLQYEYKNLQGLSGQQWDTAQSALNQLNHAMNQSHALAYSMENVDQQFKQRYPGYNHQATTDYSSEYKSWVQTNQATMNGVLDQIHASYAQQQQEEAMDQILANRAKSPAGNMQALQVGNEIAAEQIAQLQKLKATMMAQANAEAEYYAYQSQKDAAQQKSVDAVVQKASNNFPAYQGNSQFGLIPQFGIGG